MRSIKKNFIYQSAYQLLTIILPIVTAPYISRVIGASGVGIYSYTYSIASYFALFAKLGIHVYGVRAIAAVRDDKEKLYQEFSNIYTIHAIFAAVVLAVYCIYAAVLPSEYKIIVWIQIFYVVAEFLDINWFYFGLEKFKITVVRNSIVKIATIAAIFIFVRSTDDVWKYCAIMASGSLLSQSIVWAFLPRYVKFRKPQLYSYKKHLPKLIGFFIPSVAVSIYKVMDKIMLGIFLTERHVGYYENSEKVISMTLSLVAALGTVMMPRMSNLIARGARDASIRLIGTSMHFMVTVSMAMAFGIAAVAKVFTPIFFGEEFASCNIFVVGLTMSMPFTAFANVIRTQYLTPNNKDRAFQLSVIMGACINFGINFILIQYIGVMGAVVGTVVAEATVCVIQTLCARKELPIMSYLKQLLPCILSGIIMFAAVYFMGEIMGTSIITLLVQIASGVTIYAVLMGLYWYKTQDEFWKMCSRLFKNVYVKIKK